MAERRIEECAARLGLRGFGSEFPDSPSVAPFHPLTVRSIYCLLALPYRSPVAVQLRRLLGILRIPLVVVYSSSTCTRNVPSSDSARCRVF